MTIQELRSYLIEMEKFYDNQAKAKANAGFTISPEGDKRLADFCGHLV